MAAGEARATSFGQVADDYDRLRPGPVADALDWLVPDGCQLAVDLGAGTGLFSRALAGRVRQVTAVEPDERMRAVLAARSPGVVVVAGRGEAIPLPDGCADAVFASSAWHWLDHEAAVPEIARVLRDGGRLGLIWTGRDHGVDWVTKLDLWGGQPAGDHARRRRRVHEVTLPPDAPFGGAGSATFTFTRSMSVDDATDWLGTHSRFITAPAEERAAGLAAARAAIAGRADENGMVQMPMRSACWRANRVPRSATGRG